VGTTNLSQLREAVAHNASNVESLATYHLLQIVEIVCLAVLAHFVIRLIQLIVDWLIRKSAAKKSPVGFVTQKPKFITLTGLITGFLTLALYSIALGFILWVLGVNPQKFLTTYLATASIIAFAVGFGSQSFIQDVITGLTLIFTDTLEVGDMVEISGYIGRVEKVGLRFTELRNYFNQRVFLSNHNISNIARYPRGGVHAYVDVQIPPTADRAKVVETVQQLAKGMREQFNAIILQDPEFSDIQPLKSDTRFLRIAFKIWPGQGPLLETAFRQRVVDSLKQLDASYADWMVLVTYRATGFDSKSGFSI